MYNEYTKTTLVVKSYIGLVQIILSSTLVEELEKWKWFDNKSSEHFRLGNVNNSTPKPPCYNINHMFKYTTWLADIKY